MEKIDSKKSIIIGLLIIIGVCFLVTGCGFKSINTEEFKNHFSALGYTINENEKGPYESKTYSVATKEDVPFKIEYYEFDDEVEAQKVYKNYKESIVNYITSDSKDQQTTGAVITKYVATSEKEYIVISRVKKTLIFINGTVEQKDTIDKLLKDINY